MMQIKRQYSNTDIFTPVVRPDPLGENEYLTERAGYIPARQQIENLVAAGERLEEYRNKMYSNMPDEEPEPNRLRYADDMDVIDESKLLKKRLEKQARDARQKQEQMDAEIQQKNSKQQKEASKEGDKPQQLPDAK